MIKKRNFSKIIFLILFLFPFILYVIEKHKEMRLLIPILPFLCVITSNGLIYFAGFFKKHKDIILYLIVVFWLLQTIPMLKFDRYDDKLDPFYSYVASSKIDEGIWISNPSFIVFSDKKAEELIYYPLYYSVKAKELQQKAGKAEAVLINTCDIFPCPEPDKTCLRDTDELIRTLNENLDLVYYGKQEQCEHYIFQD